MSSSNSRLASLLREEQERGYDDSAAIDGLESILGRWARQATVEGVSAATIAEVRSRLSGYGAKAPDERQAAVAAVLDCLSAAQVSLEQPPAPEPAGPRPTIVPAPRPQRRSRGTLSSPASEVRSVGEQREKLLARLGVITVRDLLYFFPRDYVDYSALKTISQLRVGEYVTIIATVIEVTTRKLRNGQPVTLARLSDGTSMITAKWYNRRGLEQQLPRQQEILVSGQVGQWLGYLEIGQPEWEAFTPDPQETARIVPVYPLTEGLHPKAMRRATRAALDDFGDQVVDHLPLDILREYDLPELGWSLASMHFPEDWASQHRAAGRLAFDEFLMLQLGMLQRRQAARAAAGTPLTVTDEWTSAYERGLPFELTGAQRRSLAEIRADLAQPHPMARLLQGDVGSGKTVVALGAMLAAVANGRQAALMAPTEILAEQHYRGISRLLEQGEGEPFATAKTALLIGSMSSADKAAARERIASGEANVVIGTHALIQEHVSFQDLALVVVDEQHRFGVEQRAQLTAKGEHPHLLAMSATPIPRTLALVVFADLDLSVIDEMPPGRRDVFTGVRGDRDRERVYSRILKEASNGKQSFIVCPAIEGTSDDDTRAVTEEYERLTTEVFPTLRLGLLHGRMPARDKDRTMQEFAAGELDVLVATSVVEVGIDVPNATMMMVEDADRFGLAQLHQFRGRVGRGTAQSFCALMTRCVNDKGEPTEPRLKAIETETNGFRLAEIDLQLRGPGEFFGTRQSGLPDLQVARLSDLRTLEMARRAAERLLGGDPDLAAPEHSLLAEALRRFWQQGTAEA